MVLFSAIGHAGEEDAKFRRFSEEASPGVDLRSIGRVIAPRRTGRPRATLADVTDALSATNGFLGGVASLARKRWVLALLFWMLLLALVIGIEPIRAVLVDQLSLTALTGSFEWITNALLPFVSQYRGAFMLSALLFTLGAVLLYWRDGRGGKSGYRISAGTPITLRFLVLALLARLSGELWTWIIVGLIAYLVAYLLGAMWHNYVEERAAETKDRGEVLRTWRTPGAGIEPRFPSRKMALAIILGREGREVVAAGIAWFVVSVIAFALYPILLLWSTLYGAMHTPDSAADPPRTEDTQTSGE